MELVQQYIGVCHLWFRRGRATTDNLLTAVEADMTTRRSDQISAPSTPQPPSPTVISGSLLLYCLLSGIPSVDWLHLLLSIIYCCTSIYCVMCFGVEVPLLLHTTAALYRWYMSHKNRKGYEYVYCWRPCLSSFRHEIHRTAAAVEKFQAVVRLVKWDSAVSCIRVP